MSADEVPERCAPPPDWPAYYRHSSGREPRPLFVKGMSLAAEAGIGTGQAIEIGFGDGTESLALLRAGWRVLAVDPTPQAAEYLLEQAPPDAVDRLEIRTAPAQAVELPPFDLLYAGYALSFLETNDFRRFWTGVRAALRPGGIVIVNVFGVHDTWAGDPFMTFLERDAVERMAAGLEVLALDEEDVDGDSFVGPKHWHVFDLVARRPPG
jgi:SAM-dependent methyltransferase